jgi:nicotinamide mononucleotide adenylyltransferase
MNIGESVYLDVGVFVGRVNPLHKGHVRAIGEMTLHHGKHSLLMIGSPNEPLGLRNLFTYHERRDFAKTIFPDLNVVPIPDFRHDDDWFNALLDITEAVFPFFHRLNLYCGDVRDIESFNHKGKLNVVALGRYKEQIVSATEVRLHLMRDNFEALEELLPEQLVGPVYELGRRRLYELLTGVV